MEKREHLVQARLSKGDYGFLVKEADKEGCSIAAYLRRLVKRDRRAARRARGRS